MSDILALLRHQCARGPLPARREGLPSWLLALAGQLPQVRIEIASASVSPLRAVGIVVEETEGKAFARVPADGDALDRLVSLLGLPAIEGGGAALLVAELERAPDASRVPPALSLPLRIQAAKACSLGWSSELFTLTVLVSNVSLRHGDGAVLPRGGPVVAVCAEYDRPLTSLDPPTVASYALRSARAAGMPTVRLPAGFLRGPLRLEATSRTARAPRDRPAALQRAGQFLDELHTAWKQRPGPVLEIAWPVYRSERDGPPLDAVVGRPLPEVQLR
ncbi:MAG TPA: hypothetical protein VFE90_07080 [Myxococcales bacterium]|nr:hypothetical protein [Myxococcales bacterium]